MSKRKRFLFLFGSSMLVASFVFTFNFTHAPTAFAAYSEACPPSQSYGSNSTWVQVIQFTLNSYDSKIPHWPLAIDGQFGQKTKDAVVWYQKNVMNITDGGGVVGNRTWSNLGFCTGFSLIFYHSYHPGLSCNYFPGLLSYGSSGTWVQALQQALNMDAVASFPYYPISKSYNGDNWWPLALDGQFGSHTRDAVKSLQAANGITQDGIVGNQTWSVAQECYW